MGAPSPGRFPFDGLGSFVLGCLIRSQVRKRFRSWDRLSVHNACVGHSVGHRGAWAVDCIKSLTGGVLWCGCAWMLWGIVGQKTETYQSTVAVVLLVYLWGKWGKVSEVLTVCVNVWPVFCIL